MTHQPVRMNAAYFDSYYKRGAAYLIKKFTCPKCGKKLVLRSNNPAITHYVCDGINTKREDEQND